MKCSIVGVSSLAAVLAVALSACSGASGSDILDPTAAPMPASPCDPKVDPACKATGGAGATSAGSAGSGSGSAGLECPFKGPPVDFTKLPACAPGARCVPEDAVLSTQRALLKKCDSGLCVPEPMIATGGNYAAPTCNSIAGAEGRCLGTAIPLVADQATLLPQDSCAATERCVPCSDPLTGEKTPACTIGCDTGPKKPATVLESCCDGLAKCVATASIASSQRARLNSDGCDDDTEVCVPKDLGNKAPPACTPGLLAGGGKGVCLSKCVETDFFGDLEIGRGGCASDHVCVPCTKNGKPTNAPGCS